MEKIILLQYLDWYFIDSSRTILKGWKNYLLFNLNFFSIPILFKTFFSYWRKYSYSYGKFFDPARYFEAFTFNLMSRVIGAILRLFFIIVGLAAEISIFLIGFAVFIIWLVLPLLLVSGFLLGISLIFL